MLSKGLSLKMGKIWGKPTLYNHHPRSLLIKDSMYFRDALANNKNGFRTVASKNGLRIGWHDAQETNRVRTLSSASNKPG
jgi:hypothetical protein